MLCVIPFLTYIQTNSLHQIWKNSLVPVELCPLTDLNKQGRSWISGHVGEGADGNAGLKCASAAAAAVEEGEGATLDFVKFFELSGCDDPHATPLVPRCRRGTTWIWLLRGLFDVDVVEKNFRNMSTSMKHSRSSPCLIPVSNYAAILKTVMSSMVLLSPTLSSSPIPFFP
jgi:hypothetical protein